ncbi:thiamine pyrophosphate-binding protein [Synechococcus sp. PCC 7336]|uniref:thiamine pyrophosphate-binding protein n=1 Tax=Synechococcus sp. PCC 7336 TaxID=195250 RepID=UPI0003468B1D|nr:thiamine pyrophosphate-binding protein [Synechococcus sp. PCC 7336]
MPDRQDLAQTISTLSAAQRSLLGARLSDTSVDGSTLIARSLKELGIGHIYSIAGTPIDRTLTACAEVGICVVGVRHQNNGVLMALAQNYVAGQLVAAAILSAGPAVTNAATGILVAWDNAWPLLVLGGRRSLQMQGKGQFQELDAVALFQSITKYAGLVATIAEIPNALRHAVGVAIAARPGPVYLDIAEEVFTDTQSTAISSALTPTAVTGQDEPFGLPISTRESLKDHPQAIQRAAHLLSQASRPALIVGKGVRWSTPYAALDCLVNRYRIPFVTSPMGRGFLPDDHPICYTSVRAALLATADVVLVLGARLNWTFRFGAELRAETELIQIDIEAAELEANVKPDVGIVGDVEVVLAQLLAYLEQSPPKHHCLPTFHTWLRELDRQKAQKEREIEPLLTSDAIPMSPQRLVHEIQACLPRNAICIVDGSVILAATQQVLKTYLPVSRLTPGSNGCIGTGIPFAIGAKLAQPDRLVVAICGDTGIGMSLMELETAVRYQIPLIVAIANNNGNSGSLRSSSHLDGEARRIAMFQPDLRYEQIVSVLGGYGEFITSPQDIQPALQRAIAANTAACINVKVDPAAPYPLL